MASVAASRTTLPLARLQELILPVGLIAGVFVILVPLPAPIMDVLLSANIGLAVIVLLTTVYVRTPLEFSIFPTLLLGTTLARLVLNVATTRLILTQAQTKGLLAAGGVVKSFGQFVTGDKLVVGLILFSIIVVIQFVVITKGATRISEVAARFALDGMPGRQMAIDADLNAGLIGDQEAQRRRADVARQADFFGAMDGASKFVRGDAIAGILITLVNILGGLVIGVFDAGMGLGEATNVFTRLTIGDGLVSQIPAFLISLAAGLLVTRSTSETNLPAQFLQQLMSRPTALAVAGVFLLLLVFTSLPAIPLVGLGAGCLGLAVMLFRRESETQTPPSTTSTQAAPKPEPRVEDFLSVDPMEIEIGAGLIRLADPKRGGDLLERIQRARQTIAAELGLIMPKVRVRDNLRLEQNRYRIKIADIPVAEGLLYPAMYLATGPGVADSGLTGLPCEDPASDAPALWIESRARDQAEIQGCTLVEPVSVLVTHLTEVVRQHADEILNRDATRHLIDELKKTAPAVVEELIPEQLKLAEVQQILHLLLREQVSIRHLGPILEALGEQAPHTKNPQVLVEAVREKLARALSNQYRDKDRRLHVVTLSVGLEQRLRAAIDPAQRGLNLKLAPAAIEAVCRGLADEMEKLSLAGRPAVVLTSPAVRAALKQLTSGRLPRLVVLSYNEITRDTRIEAVGQVEEVASVPLAA